MTEEVVLAPGYVTIPGFVNQMSDSLYQLQQQGVLCDVRLQGENGYVMAHAPVLSAASPFLKRLFTQTDRMENPLTGRSVDELQNFVRLVYTGKLFLTFSNAFNMATLLRRLEIHDIAKILQEYCKVETEDERTDEKPHGIKRKRSTESSGGDITETDERLQSEVDYSENITEESKPLSENGGKDEYTEDSDCSYHSENEEDVVDEQEDVEMQADFSELMSEETEEKTNVFSSTRIETVEEVVEESLVNYAVNGNTEDENKNDQHEEVMNNAPDKEAIQLFTVELENTPNEAETTSRHVMKTRSSAGKKDLRYVIIKKGEIIGNETTGTIDISSNSDLEYNKSDGNNSASDVTTKTDQLVNSKSKNKVKRTGQKNKYCAYCGKMFRKLHYLQLHEEKCEGEQGGKSKPDWSLYRQKQTCELCAYSTAVKSCMVRHKYMEHGIEFDRTKYKVFECQYPECNFFHMTQELLTDHIKTEHLGLASEIASDEEFMTPKTTEAQSSKEGVFDICMFHCPLCGSYYLDKNSLEQHMKIKHEKEKSFLCHHCPYKTAYRREIDIHMFKAHDVPLPSHRKKYHCSFCDYFTFFKRDLEAHINRHNGVRNYVCEVCGATFTSRNGLVGHSSRHKEKTECPYDGCNYKGVSQELKKHVQVMHTHKDHKPFSCHLCGFKTKTNGTLSKHLQVQHKLEVVTKNKLFEQMMTTGEGYDAVAYKNRLEAMDRVAHGGDDRNQTVFNLDQNPFHIKDSEFITDEQNETIATDSNIHGNVISVDGLGQVISGDSVGTIDGGNIVVITTTHGTS